MTLIKATVTFEGLTEYQTRLTPAIIQKFIPDPEKKSLTMELLHQNGFITTSQSELTLSIQGSKENFEKLFSTELEEIPLMDFDKPFDSKTPFLRKASRSSFLFPKKDVWKSQHILKQVYADAYIQSPYYFANNRFKLKKSRFPARVKYHHLRLPGDVAMVLNASKVHRKGITGKGVKVVILDSGFNFKHHHFTENGYSVKPIAGPGATNPDQDVNGHGTAMAANLLAVAPGANLVGVKLLNDDYDELNTTMAEGLETALSLNPDIISLSLAIDLFDKTSSRREHLRSLFNNLKAVEGLILLAVSRGITVVCASGNEEVAFPAMMPEVIAVGGVFVNCKGEMYASDFTSAFTSKIYFGRSVPDLCGLSGHKNKDKKNQIPGGYIMSPVERSGRHDHRLDGTKGNDEWAVIGGSSTATAQVAGVCALMLEKNPNLSPQDIKIQLQLNARDVTKGVANKASNEFREIEAHLHRDNAVGHGLVDAFESVFA